MLILTRRAGEAILLDGGIRIVVIGTDGASVRLGIEAPASVGIVREEVAQRRGQEPDRTPPPGNPKSWSPAVVTGEAGIAEGIPEANDPGGRET